jgi:hypothetical protein
LASKGQIQQGTFERRELVRRMVQRGFHHNEILQMITTKYGVVETTVKKDLWQVRKEDPTAPARITLDKMLETSMVNLDDLRAEYWRIYFSLDEPKYQLATLAQIQKTEIERYSILEKAGIISGSISPPGGASGPGVRIEELYALMESMLEMSGQYIDPDRWDEFVIRFKQIILEFSRDHAEDPRAIPAIDIKSSAKEEEHVQETSAEDVYREEDQDQGETGTDRPGRDPGEGGESPPEEENETDGEVTGLMKRRR